ncbi:MAG: hypothetical protein ACH34V_07130 [Flavobacterium sp.]|uniref:hypothetical protein n=1 Tax=Flavobacterium sp. TaxID=239 RepID=UPI003796ABAA
MAILIFNNSFGDLFVDKIYLKDNRIDLDLDYIVKFKIYYVNQIKLKLFFLFFSLLALLFSILLIKYLLFHISCLLLIIIIIFYDNKKYYLKIKTKNINDDYILSVSKKKLNDAKTFVYEVTNYKEKINFEIQINKLEII